MYDWHVNPLQAIVSLLGRAWRSRQNLGRHWRQAPPRPPLLCHRPVQPDADAYITAKSPSTPSHAVSPSACAANTTLCRQCNSSPAALLGLMSPHLRSCGAWKRGAAAGRPCQRPQKRFTLCFACMTRNSMVCIQGLAVRAHTCMCVCGRITVLVPIIHDGILCVPFLPVMDRCKRL